MSIKIRPLPKKEMQAIYGDEMADMIARERQRRIDGAGRGEKPVVQDDTRPRG